MSKLIIKNVRFSYPNLFTPRAMSPGQPEKYSVSILIPKDDAVTVAAVKKAIKVLEAETLKDKYKNKKPNGWKTPLRDGDEERSDSPEYAGMYFMGCNSKNKPGVIDLLKNKLDQEDLYAGCYGHVSVNLYAYDVSGNRGIAAGLQNVLKTKDGERLSGGASAESDFGDLLEEGEALLSDDVDSLL